MAGSHNWGPGMAQGWYGISNNMMQARAPSLLSVSDVERMAKAGVKIDMEQIKDQVIPDPPRKEVIFNQVDENGWLRDFLRRWDRAQPIEPTMMHRDFEHVSVVRGKENFHVFVVMSCGAVAHLTDTLEAYPSEALVAKLILLKKEGKRDG